MNYKKLHKELWTWLADNPSKGKTEWPRWEENDGDISYVTNFCFSCKEASIRGGSAIKMCENCPLIPQNKNNVAVLGCLNGLFHKWYFGECLSLRASYARTIANLEWRDK